MAAARGVSQLSNFFFTFFLLSFYAWGSVVCCHFFVWGASVLCSPPPPTFRNKSVCIMARNLNLMRLKLGPLEGTYCCREHFAMSRQQHSTNFPLEVHEKTPKLKC